LDEDSSGGFISEKDVIGTRQRNKSCVGNFGRQYSTLFRWRAIVITLKYDGCDRNGGEKAAHVDFVTSFQDAHSVSWRRGHALQIIPPSLVLMRCVIRNKSFCEHVRKAGKVFPPVQAYERHQRPPLGPRRFDIGLIQEGDKYFVGLTQKISPEFEFVQKIEFPGISDAAHPHTFELRYDHTSQTASLRIDGRLTASGYRGHNQFLEDRGLMIGSTTYLSSKTGIGIFRSVRFEAY